MKSVWRFDITDMFSMFAAIVLGLGFFAFVAYMVYLFVFRRIQMTHEMRLELVKQGRDLPVETERFGSLKAGMVLCAVGLGLFFSLMLEAESNGGTLGGESVIAFVPFLTGLGLIGFHLAVRKSSKNDNQSKGGYSSESLDP